MSAHLIGVGPILVLGAVTGIAEGLAATFLLTHVRLLTRVRPKVRLQVLKARIGLPTAFKLRDVKGPSMFSDRIWRFKDLHQRI